MAQAVRGCRNKMLEKGVDLSVYNSAASAQDVKDLTHALGYKKVNLFGVSYGTRLALTIMRDIPDIVRSVILDSALPPNVRVDVDGPWRLDRSLNLIFSQCEADKQCRRTFPHLRKDFDSTLVELDKHPLVLPMDDTTRFPDGVINLDGSVLAGGVFKGLYHRDFIPFFPLLIREAKHRNKEVLAAVANRLVMVPHIESAGDYLAVHCYEAFPFESDEQMKTAEDEHPELSPYYKLNFISLMCKNWNQAYADSAEFQPVRSDIPTLILAGEFDPITPPRYGKLAAKTLPNSTFV